MVLSLEKIRWMKEHWKLGIGLLMLIPGIFIFLITIIMRIREKILNDNLEEVLIAALTISIAFLFFGGVCFIASWVNR